MRELWIKICGMRTASDVAAAVTAGADALGFVFYEPSPRHLSLDEARQLQASVPADVERVAVFMHPTQAQLDAVLDALRPDWVQTDIEDLERLTLPPGQRVMAVLRGAAAADRRRPVECREPGAVGVHGRSAAQEHERLMLDGAVSGVGARADWSTGRSLASSCELVLAGGLDAGNVTEAIRAVRPFGVDVSSGVERARGVKDPVRIGEFVVAARSAGRAVGGEAVR